MRKDDNAVDNLSNEIKLLGKDIDNKFEKINTKFAEQDKNFTHEFDKIDKKFAEQKNWFYGTAISIITITCTIIGLMIKFIK